MEKHITFLTSSGNQYILPLDVEVRSIRALPEGVLIGWGKDFNYGVLSGHPMGHITPLGTLGKSADSNNGLRCGGIPLDKWLNSNDEIVYTNRHVPIIVSYNSYFQRHSVYFLWRSSSTHE